MALGDVLVDLLNGVCEHSQDKVQILQLVRTHHHHRARHIQIGAGKDSVHRLDVIFDRLIKTVGNVQIHIKPIGIVRVIQVLGLVFNNILDLLERIGVFDVPLCGAFSLELLLAGEVNAAEERNQRFFQRFGDVLLVRVLPEPGFQRVNLVEHPVTVFLRCGVLPAFLSSVLLHILVVGLDLRHLLPLRRFLFGPDLLQTE